MMLTYRTFIRKLSTKHSVSELYQARQWLANLTADSLPHEQFNVSFSRSSGPGGQNVNKVSSKATIKLTKDQWMDGNDWIPVAIRDQLQQSSFPYTTKSGSLVIQSDLTRNRHDNLQNCYDKLVQSIKDHVHIESGVDENDLKKWEKIHKRTNEERLEKKKFAAAKKQSRKISKGEDF